jgi:hypothetical protein
VQLPFSEAQFLSVFASYNAATAAAIVVLWLLTAAALAWLAVRRQGSTMITLLLVMHWAWAGAAYHLTFFAAINPAARAFGALFLLQALLFLASGRLEYHWGRTPRQALSLIFCASAMLYPLLALVSGMRWPRMPSFGVPCPTTLLTVGLLLAVEPGRARWLSVVPLIWTGVGGSAAVLLGVTPDLMLWPGAVLLLLNIVAPHALTKREKR